MIFQRLAHAREVLIMPSAHLGLNRLLVRALAHAFSLWSMVLSPAAWGVASNVPLASVKIPPCRRSAAASGNCWNCSFCSLHSEAAIDELLSIGVFYFPTFSTREFAAKSPAELLF
jgi:hypothetical protein